MTHHLITTFLLYTLCISNLPAAIQSSSKQHKKKQEKAASAKKKRTDAIPEEKPFIVRLVEAMKRLDHVEVERLVSTHKDFNPYTYTLDVSEEEGLPSNARALVGLDRYTSNLLQKTIQQHAHRFRGEASIHAALSIFKTISGTDEPLDEIRDIAEDSHAKFLMVRLDPNGKRICDIPAMLDEGANPHNKVCSFITMLSFAIQKSVPEWVELLVEHPDADLEERSCRWFDDDYKITPLGFARNVATDAARYRSQRRYKRTKASIARAQDSERIVAIIKKALDKQVIKNLRRTIMANNAQKSQQQ